MCTVLEQERHCTLVTVPLSNQEYKWVPLPLNSGGQPDKMPGVTCDKLVSNPGGSNMFASCYRSVMRLGSVYHFGLHANI